MNLDKKILKEINRHHNINRYIREQAEAGLPPDPALGAVPGADLPAPDATLPPAPADAPAEKIDVSADDEVTKIDDEGKSSESGTEELDVTDLVKSSE
jgi:hypothetical protein